MSRTVSTAVALTLGIAISAAVAVTLFAQKNQAAQAVSPKSSSADATSSDETKKEPSPSEPGGRERQSIRTGSLSISATGKTNPKTIKEDSQPRIELDSSNIRENARSSLQPIRESKRELQLTSKLPAGSLAASLADSTSETVQIWRPAYASQGFRGARLDAFAVSQDGTVLAIAERTGTATGPNGTRIILVDTSSWQFIRIFTVDRFLKKIAFVPDTETLAAIAYPQTDLKQPFGIQLLDLKAGMARDFWEIPFPFNEKFSPEQIALLTDKDGVFCSGFFDNKVFFQPYRVVAKDPAAPSYYTFETVAPVSALAFTPDGRTLAAVSQKAIEYFDLAILKIEARGEENNRRKRRSFTTLDLGWAPVDLHFLGGAQTDFIACPSYQDDSPPVVVRSSAKESLDGRSAGFAIPMNNGKQIGVAFKVKGRIDIVDPATLGVEDSAILEQLRPITTGDVVFVYYMDAIRAFCAIDANGNCFAVGKREGDKRWTKRIIWNGAGKR